jgi:hypothetical protein
MNFPLNFNTKNSFMHMIPSWPVVFYWSSCLWWGYCVFYAICNFFVFFALCLLCHIWVFHLFSFPFASYVCLLHQYFFGLLVFLCRMCHYVIINIFFGYSNSIFSSVFSIIVSLQAIILLVL